MLQRQASQIGQVNRVVQESIDFFEYVHVTSGRCSVVVEAMTVVIGLSSVLNINARNFADLMYVSRKIVRIIYYYKPTFKIEQVPN